ncbi:MAG: hypothetical protein ACM3NT_10115 [Methylocystaceae bacterium]
MRNTLIGCSLSITGALGYLAVMIFVGNNLVSGWSTPPGRFLTTVAEREMIFPFIVSLCILVIGLTILAVEFFKKEN